VSDERRRGLHIAKRLLEIEAVSLSPETPFTWASGLRSPIYCDNRATLAHPEIRREIAAAFSAVIESDAGQVDAVIGVATGAIAHAAFVAEHTGLPMGYIRSGAKQHGRRNRIEGFAREGSRVVVIEDLISTGGSSLAAVEGVREAGMEVIMVAAIFTYGFSFAHQSFEQSNVRLSTLVNLQDLIAAGQDSGSLNDNGVDILQSWRQDPKAWSKRFE
jgi:orotate phosphoribosyltransferase